MKQAMIFAAGLGTRLKPLTDTMPKALVPVNGVPLLDLIIRRLIAQGYERFVVNVHHFAQMIIDHVRNRTMLRWFASAMKATCCSIQEAD